MRYLFQIFTGDLSEKSLANADDLLQKLEPFHEAGKLDGVLCGWSRDREFYLKMKRQLSQWEVPFLFKTAVFSEWESVTDFDPMIDFKGEPMQPYVLNPQEHFLFRCPSSEKNRRKILDFYDEQMGDIGFDGVFLDRIRYSSMLQGISGIGGCFCEECCKRYESAGLDVRQLKAALSKAEKEGMKLSSYRQGRWTLEDPILNEFFRVRCDIITESVQFFADEFHQRGLKVGLDLFSPVFGYFAGQDILALSRIADFVKPMEYRYTDAPAGIPFEHKAVERAAGQQAFRKVMEETGTSDNEYEGLVQSELKLLQNCECLVYPGMEVNTVEPIVYITPERVLTETSILKQNGYDRMVPAWNLDAMPKENLEVLLMQ